ncbi:hypothetical protein ABEB36_008671 [Hypothenemus hampei]|uniref:Coiled-coil domain-containing protein n=1 Tax=Hypothenemus hampei TaxID=57062 RepID=A0ABD1EN97_HYPHA
MLTNQFDSEFPHSTNWDINAFNDKDKHKVIRKFINSAIYVEKVVNQMQPQRKTSSLVLDSDDNKTPSKKYSGTSTETCSSPVISNHSSNYKLPKETKSLKSAYRAQEQSENSFQTVKAPHLETNNGSLESELRLSLTCLQTSRTCTLDPKDRQEIIQNWMLKKQLEKKQKAHQEAREAKRKEKERSMLIEKERENFKNWLAEKKKDEMTKRLQKQREVEEEKLKEAEKEKKKVENAINFNLWLRRKKKADLERKITEKLALLEIYEEKERRLQENEKAYQEWLESSKNKQKPIPLNKGLQSLNSSTSVTYVNPIPWTPNIDQNLKSYQ